MSKSDFYQWGNIYFMQGIVKSLIIDDTQHRHDLEVIFDFMERQYLTLSSNDIDISLWTYSWNACFIGNINNINNLNLIWNKLNQYPKIPVIALAQHELFSQLPNYVDSLYFPFNIHQLNEAFRKSHYFLSQPSISGTQNLLFRSMVGSSKAITEIRRLIEQVAACDVSVLISGESGTGKEVMARNVHYRSKRSDGAFITVNCSAVSPELLERELFGYEKNAFDNENITTKGRLELANGGTLFLDDIAHMPLSIQTKLLRVLKEHSFERIGGTQSIHLNVRIIAATHCDLEQMIDDNLFREDLYYRLNVFPMTMPALRDRINDLPLLLQELLTRMEINGAKRIYFTPQAIDLLMLHDWPNNIDELANLVDQLTSLYQGEIVDVNHLPNKYHYQQSSYSNVELSNITSFNNKEFEINAISKGLPPEGLNLKEMLAELEVNMIRQALNAQSNIVTHAADMLGMRRTTLVEKMRKYGLSKES